MIDGWMDDIEAIDQCPTWLADREIATTLASNEIMSELSCELTRALILFLFSLLGVVVRCSAEVEIIERKGGVNPGAKVEDIPAPAKE
jgi:hypothetical protein